ncbi:Hypothetical protein A7982_04906 [Minicystis rosea]|nr:Hypothetical protein A7982_04906 [Minicystis rosea]
MVMRALGALLLAVGVATAGVGCTLILGADEDYHEVDGGSSTGSIGPGGGTSDSASSGSVGPGGSGGGTSVSSTAATSSTSSTGGPTMCRLKHDAEDCKTGERCTIADPDTGSTKCVAITATPSTPYAACTTDEVCPAGTWCDARTATCAPFCASSNDCGGGLCVAAEASNPNTTTHTVPGATVCTANCDPVSATSCGPNAACNYDFLAGAFDCFQSQNQPIGSSCSFAECAPTLVCGSTCLAWCFPAGAPSLACPGFADCNAFSNLTPMYNGVTYGYCNP